jgi:hypothetical protein
MDLGKIAEIATAVANGGLFVVAWVQLAAARRETRETQTLIACGQYDLNENVFNSHREILKAKDAGTLEQDAHRLRLEITNVLNFLDAIAIGIEQKFYDDEVAYRHLKSIVSKHVNDLIETPILAKAGCTRDHYTSLIDLNARWARRN